MAYLHCKFQYNVAIIKSVFSSVESAEDGIDFVTGDITLSSRYFSEWYDFGAANGSTLIVAAIANDTSITVASDAGKLVGERISILLDNGLRHATYIESLPGAGVINLVNDMPSSAAIGNNVVTASQLEGTTDGTLEEDFKIFKSQDIINKSNQLLESGFIYNSHHFPMVGDMEPGLRSQTLYVDYLTDISVLPLIITATTQTNPCVVTLSSIGDLKTFDTVMITGVVGMTEINAKLYTVGFISGNDLELWQYPSLANIDSTSYTAYISGGLVIKQEAGAFKNALDSDGHSYLFADNADLVNYLRAFVGQRFYIFGVSGQTGLLAQVSMAANTQAAMDGITDNR